MTPCTSTVAREELARIALVEDARIAAILSRPQPREHHLLRLRGTFDARSGTTINSQLELNFDRYVTSDCIVLATDYILRSPFYFRESVFGPQAAFFRTKGDTWIEVLEERIQGEDARILFNRPMPMEHVFGNGCKWVGPRVLAEGEQLLVTLALARDLIDNEVLKESPLEVTITLKVLQLGGCLWRQMRFQDAVAELISKGINPWGEQKAA